MTGQRLLVVGSGFIASHLALRAHRKWGWHVDVLYRNFRNPVLDGLSTHPVPTTLDALEALLSDIGPEWVVLAAGSSFVPEINRDIQSAMDQHLNATLLVLDALARRGVHLKKVLTVGSASEYGSFPADPVDETHRPMPRDAYGIMKLAQRQIGLYFHNTHGLPVTHVRQFNVTGEGQDQRFVLPSICTQVAAAMAEQRVHQPVQIIAGNTAVRRDFLAIDDVCEAYRVLLEQGLPGQTYNVCSGVATSIDELIALAATESGLDLAVRVSLDLVRESDKAQAVVCGDSAKLRGLGWTPRVAMPELVGRMIAHHAANRRN